MLNLTTDAKIFRNSNGHDCRIIERSKSGKNALLIDDNNEITPYIIAWNCPEEQGSWGQGHYYSDFADALHEWNYNYLEE